jgi:hypothetical protein
VIVRMDFSYKSVPVKIELEASMEPTLVAENLKVVFGKCIKFVDWVIS